MTSSDDPPSRQRAVWWLFFGWIALVLPQASLWIVDSVALIPFGNSVRGFGDVAVYESVLGFASGTAVFSCQAVLAVVFLLNRSAGRRATLALSFVGAYLAVTLLVTLWHSGQLFEGLDWAEDPSRAVASFLLAPSLAGVTLLIAAAMQLRFGWVITREKEVRRPVTTLVLFEYVLVSAIVFFFARSWSDAQPTHSGWYFYDIIVFLIPAIGLGVITVILIYWMLGERTKRVLPAVIALFTPALVFGAALLMLEIEPYVAAFPTAQTRSERISYALPALAWLIAGVVWTVPLIYCVRALGYRLITSASRGKDNCPP